LIPGADDQRTSTRWQAIATPENDNSLAALCELIRLARQLWAGRELRALIVATTVSFNTGASSAPRQESTMRERLPVRPIQIDRRAIAQAARSPIQV
jgi:hypothetical protein